jgi:hypothetical protein
MRGFHIQTDLPADLVAGAIQSNAGALGWTQQWTNPFLAQFEKGSVATDLILGPFMPHQVAVCEITSASGCLGITLRQEKSRWYGGGKTEPRKARRDFDRLAMTIAQSLMLAGDAASAVPFRQ